MGKGRAKSGIDAPDTAFMLVGGFSADMIIDLAFHVWMIVTMSIGLSANKKLKALPEEQPFDEGYTIPSEQPDPDDNQNTDE